MAEPKLHEVVVGNIGRVFSGSTRAYARYAFDGYVDASKMGYGRATGEDVIWFIDGEIFDQYLGSISLEEEREVEGNEL